MADLSAMYRATAESVPQPDEMMLGALGMQRIMNNGLQYQQERDNLEAMRGLRALFAKNPDPSLQEIGAISPGFAQEYGKNRFAMQRDLLGMQRDRAEIGKIEGQVTEQDAKAWAPIFGSIAEKYADGGNIEQFRAEIGQAIAQGQAQGLRLAPQFDINSLDPLTTLQRAQSLGYRSQYLETQGAVGKEQQLRGLPPAPTAGQYYGEASIDPTTAMPMRTPPVVGPGAQPGPEAWQHNKPAPRNRFGRPMPKPGSLPETANVPTFDQVTDVKMLEEVYKQLPNGSPDKIAAGRRLQELMQGNDADASYNDEPDERFASPGEVQQAREQRKRTEEQIQTDEAKKRETNKLEIERQAERQKFLDLVATFPPVPEVEALLKASTSGAMQHKAADAYEAVTGQATPGMAAIGRLKAIQQTLQDSITKLQGDPTLREVMLKAGAVGDLNNPDIGWNARLDGYRQFIETLQKKVAQYMGGTPGARPNATTSEHTPRAQQLIDAHKAKTISDEQFAKEWDELPEGEY